MTTKETQIPKYWVSFSHDRRLPAELRGKLIYKGNNKADALKAQKTIRKHHGWWATDSFQARGPF
jgi:hypothetical protein